MIDIGAEQIRHAVREYNAAANSYMRANEELQKAIPLGFVVLHKAEGDTDEHPVYWSYEGREDVISESAGRKDKYDGYRVIIIEAPARRAEFLPRLEEIGDCKHGKQRDWCVECLRLLVSELAQENARLRADNASMKEADNAARWHGIGPYYNP